MSSKWIKIIKLIISIVTPLCALICTGVEILFPDFFTIDRSITVALALLTGLAFTVSLDEYGDEQKWKTIEANLTAKWDSVSSTMTHKIDSVSNCRIQTFDNTVKWVEAIDELIKTGHHSIAHASLDAATRNKAPSQHKAIWKHILDVCENREITYRHIIRIRPNNFENLLDRITAGNSRNESYFAYYELPPDFPFATFEVIDGRYIATRSPFIQGEEPCYMIIDNSEIGAYFLRYFDKLWLGSAKIDGLSVISEFYNKFSPNYTDEKLQEIAAKIENLKKAGIMDDI